MVSLGCTPRGWQVLVGFADNLQAAHHGPAHHGILTELLGGIGDAAVLQKTHFVADMQ